jgi:hypothetical protein
MKTVQLITCVCTCVLFILGFLYVGWIVPKYNQHTYGDVKVPKYNQHTYGDVKVSTLVWSVGMYHYTQQHKISTYRFEVGQLPNYTRWPSEACLVNRSVKTFPQDYPVYHVNHLLSTYNTLYIQNLDRAALPTHTCSIIALPLGLDYHTLHTFNCTYGCFGLNRTTWKEQDIHLKQLRDKSTQRKCKVLVTWGQHNSSSNKRVKDGYKSRPQLWKEAMANPDVFEVGTGNRNETWKNMSQYTFVYSPIGNGFDCHRTWEALALGCIVIAQSNPTIKEFVDKYPIILHDNPGTITQEDLQKWIDEYTPATLEDLQIQNFLNFN